MNNNFSWITDERKKILEVRQSIVNNRDFESLFKLDDDSDFSITLYDILVNDCSEPYNPSNLNDVKKNLLLCMFLENSSQDDTILTFLEDDYSEYHNEIIIALNEIGAKNSACIIKRAIELLQINKVGFLKNANKKSKELMNMFDSEFSNYPDGKMEKLYRRYAECNKDFLI